MVIITTIIVAITLIITQINPITVLQDNFVVDKFQASAGSEERGEVMGATEIAVEPESGDTVPAVIEVKDLRPVLKAVYNKQPEITADSALVTDLATGAALFAKNSNEPASIASITKLMTALVVMDQNPDFSKEYAITGDDRREGGRIYLFSGDLAAVEDLFNASLVGSANTATIALVHALGFNEQDFVILMNEKARALGLKNTTFADPIGLSSFNISTASEVAEIIKYAMADKKIRATLSQPKYILKTKQGKTRIIETTNDLLHYKNGPSHKGGASCDIIGGKTGYLASAGFCFAGQFNKDGHEIISVILGSDGVDLRFSETNEIVDWAYDNYIWSNK